MKTTSTVLTKDERNVLILAALHGQHLDNSAIAERLGTSVNRVKTLLHQACVKLEARNRLEAIVFALKRGEISIDEVYSVDELAVILRSMSPDTLRRIAHIVRQQPEHRHLSRKNDQTIPGDRRQDGVLTNRERDVLILVGRGLTNREIADRLYISTGAVTVFLSRACRKLGARKRTDAFVSALKRREISVGEVFSLNDVLRFLAPLGAESIERMAQLLDQEVRQEPVPAGR